VLTLKQRVYLSAPILDSGVILVDLPGQPLSVHELNELLLNITRAPRYGSDESQSYTTLPLAVRQSVDRLQNRPGNR
jgi:hypothetical protein